MSDCTDEREAALERMADALGRFPLSMYDDYTKHVERALTDLLAADAAETQALREENEGLWRLNQSMAADDYFARAEMPEDELEVRPYPGNLDEARELGYEGICDHLTHIPCLKRSPLTYCLSCDGPMAALRLPARRAGGEA